MGELTQMLVFTDRLLPKTTFSITPGIDLLARAWTEGIMETSVWGTMRKKREREKGRYWEEGVGREEGLGERRVFGER